MVLITEQKVLIGDYLINFVISKLDNRKQEKTLFLIPGGIGERLKCKQIIFYK